MFKIFEIYIFVIFFFILPLVSISIIRFLYKTWWSRHRFFFFKKKKDKSGKIGYTGPTGRTGPSPDPSDPTAYCTHTSLAQLLASSSLLVEVYPSF